jgi:MFS family permease
VTVGANRTDRHKLILYSVAVLSLLAALIHLWVMQEHLEEWWGYGTFFLGAAIAQGLYSAAVLRWPHRSLLLLLGIGGNLLIVALYLVTRTVGVPIFGPDAGEVEEVGVTDLSATMSELAIVLTLGAVLLRDLSPPRRNLVLLILAVAILSLGHLLHLLLRAS